MMVRFTLSAFNRTMLYMLILTMVGSMFAYRIVVKAYDNLDYQVVMLDY